VSEERTVVITNHGVVSVHHVDAKDVARLEAFAAREGAAIEVFAAPAVRAKPVARIAVTAEGGE
jgi:hypothetical protein